ncbi:nitrate- and nitrite sensing domain-containing protein [Streptomyces sp. MS1.HAVA.3]|uniref:Nitrate- and nitrite sensing domain-containing protein n=1 Tax=Streptomyces caledonius TaxID=3134107 RepID=A0ABU8U1Z2_9ACTN
MRLRTLLIWLAVVPTVAMGTQVTVTAQRLLAQSEQLRDDVAAAERVGAPLYTLMVDMQAERTATAAQWAGTAGAESDLRKRRDATDLAAAEFRALAGDPDRSFAEVTRQLDKLAAYRQRADTRSGAADSTLTYYSDVIGKVIQVYQQEFSHAEDAELAQASRPVVAMLQATEMVAREDTVLALAGPSGELTFIGYDQFVGALGAQRYLHEASIVPYLAAGTTGSTSGSSVPRTGRRRRASRTRSSPGTRTRRPASGCPPRSAAGSPRTRTSRCRWPRSTSTWRARCSRAARPRPRSCRPRSPG